MKSYLYSQVVTGADTECTSKNGDNAWWTLGPVGVNCLQLDGSDPHGSKFLPGGTWYGTGVTRGRLEFPGPGIVINSGSKLTAFLQGTGKCRFYGTVIGTLIAN